MKLHWNQFHILESFTQPKLVITCLPVWMTGVQKNLPDHAKLLPNFSLNVMLQEYRKNNFLRFQYTLSFN